MARIVERASTDTIPPIDTQTNDATINRNDWKDWTSTWRKVGNSSNAKHVTMSGTITRGKKKGQSVDIELDLTEQELAQISRTFSNEVSDGIDVENGDVDENKKSKCVCSLISGLHIVFFGILCFPFVLIIAFFICLYFGLLTWHNVFNYFYDEKTICHRILLCPLLVLLFPVIIPSLSIFVAVYAAFAQITWYYVDWKSEIGSFEKGFYGWLCSSLHLESCSPYTVVMLIDPDNSTLSNLAEVDELPVFEDGQSTCH